MIRYRLKRPKDPYDILDRPGKEVQIILPANDPEDRVRFEIEGDERLGREVLERLRSAYGYQGYAIAEETTPLDVAIAMRSGRFDDLEPELIEGREIFERAGLNEIPRPGQGDVRPVAPVAEAPADLLLPFQFTVSGAAPSVLLDALIDADVAGTGDPGRISQFGDDLSLPDWPTLATDGAPGLRLEWSENSGPGSLTVELNGVVRAAREGVHFAPERILEVFERLPFEIGVIDNRYVDWELGEDTEEYHGPKPAPGHCSLGLALAVKGRGHDRLVSRRWLEYGPWALVRRDELSLVFFHDPRASAHEALLQARPGHRAMGPGPDGGWVHPNFQFSGDLSGLYDAEDREYIWVLTGRDPEPWELLEHCAVRNQQALGPDKPVERVAVVMPEEDRARQWVHAMWLRDIDLRTFVDGTEISLTADYEPPPPTPPEWVRNRSWLRD